MIMLENIDLGSIRTKKNTGLLFGFSLETGDLTSVQLIERTTTNKPTAAGWLKGEYPDDSATEEFKLADAYCYLAANAGGWGRIARGSLVFNAAGRLIRVDEI